MVNDQQIVCNEEIRNVQLLLQVFKRVDNLRLNGNVQRGNRLVANDELGVDRQRAGNADSLALTAGELVGIAAGVLTVEADQIQKLRNALRAFTLRFAEMVNVERFANDIRNRHAGIQRRIRILKYDLHVLAVLADVLFGNQRSVVPYFAGGRLV
ncbi:hypothetical protein SDC9_80517 [bioreactor metagenome]|uniref:Uncharacterized protein n=1 Tax=bioreactor metagenome TaxID=1076179 RepID=A0A644YZF4_9ZZZZ